MRRPWWVPALHYVQHSHGSWFTTERDRTSEYLYRYEMTVGQSSAHSRQSATYLDHDHSKREYIRFLATQPFVQYLGRSPPRGETTLTLGTPQGI